MNQRPPQPPQPLDAEERALARALPRLHGRTAPGPDLDASILAAAQAAVHPARPLQTSLRPRIRWVGPASLAASVVLAVGMAWQLRPLPTLEPAQPMVQSDTADSAAVRMIESAQQDKPVPMVQSKPAPATSTAPARQQAMSPAIDALEASPAPQGSFQGRSLQTPAPVPAPPALPISDAVSPSSAPAPPPPASLSVQAPPRAESPAARSGNTLDTQAVDSAVRAATAANSRDAMAHDAAAVGAAKSGMVEPAKQPAQKALAPAPAAAEMPAIRNEAQRAADAGFVDDPDNDIPPATVDAPAVRDAWLHRIGELLEQGKRQEAKASLAEFRRRYPAAVLPSRLRALEIEP